MRTERDELKDLLRNMANLKAAADEADNEKASKPGEDVSPDAEVSVKRTGSSWATKISGNGRDILLASVAFIEALKKITSEHEIMPAWKELMIHAIFSDESLF